MYNERQVNDAIHELVNLWSDAAHKECKADMQSIMQQAIIDTANAPIDDVADIQAASSEELSDRHDEAQATLSDLSNLREHLQTAMAAWASQPVK